MKTCPTSLLLPVPRIFRVVPHFFSCRHPSKEGCPADGMMRVNVRSRLFLFMNMIATCSCSMRRRQPRQPSDHVAILLEHRAHVESQTQSRVIAGPPQFWRSNTLRSGFNSASTNFLNFWADNVVFSRALGCSPQLISPFIAADLWAYDTSTSR